MRKFIRNNGRVFISIVLIIVALQFSVRAKRPFSPYKQVAWAVSGLTFFVADVFTRSINGFESFVDDYLFLVGVAKENRRLKEELDRLKGKTSMVQELKSENLRLKSILDFKDESRDEGIVASVISYDLTPWSSGFFIDAGGRDGIEPGMIVVLPDGVAGKVYRVYSNSSLVISIKDHRFSLDVRIQRTRLRCILKGTGAGCQLKYVRTTDGLSEGDIIITTGFERNAPPGTLVGVVSGMKEERGSIFRKVEVAPFVDLRKLEMVYVVKGGGGKSLGMEGSE